MTQTINLASDSFLSVFGLIFVCRDKERIFITRSTPTRDIIAYHYDRDNSKDIFVSFDLNIFSKKFLKKNSFIFLLKISRILINTNENKSFILCNIESQSSVDLIKAIYPKATIYGKYVDIMSCFFSSKDELIQNTIGCCEIDSYCKEDCLKYDIKYIPDLVNIHKLKSLKEQTIQQNYILFIGTYSKVRFISLCDFITKFSQLDIKFKFQIVFENDKDLKEQIEKINCMNNKFDYKPIQILRDFIPYETYLSLLTKALAVVDFYRLKMSEGYSFRVLECVAADIKLITNRDLKSETFYKPDVIFNVDENNPDDFLCFLSSKSSYDSKELISLQHYLYSEYLPK